MFYVFSENLAPSLVGPFETRESAQEHIEFMGRRGDAGVVVHNNARVVTTQDIQLELRLLWAFNHNCCSPEKDRAWVP